MTKQGYTELFAVLDASGSMSHLIQDTLGGVNNFIAEQKKLPGECKLTIVTFDSKVMVRRANVQIQEVQPLEHKDYWMGGTTALLDALGETISRAGARFAEMPEEERPSHVLFFITTDGQENASKEYTHEQIKAMIGKQRSEFSWEFMFLGANMDATQVAQQYNIAPNMAATYTLSAVGTASAYASFARGATSMRYGGQSTGAMSDLEDKDVTDGGIKTPFATGTTSGRGIWNDNTSSK